MQSEGLAVAREADGIPRARVAARGREGVAVSLRVSRGEKYPHGDVPACASHTSIELEPSSGHFLVPRMEVECTMGPT